ncbi:MAG: arylesterase [Hyphomicrobium aestuarii]|nr:arylesterase [Hyphomicrobium aestuarii]
MFVAIVATAIAMTMTLSTANAARIKIVAFGDSLVAGYGVKPSEGFVSQLEAALKSRGHDVEVVNSGVSGDTAMNGLERLDWAVPDDARAVILEFGANDGLTGRDPAATKTTLDTILTRIRERKLPVLIAGMKAPRNWGETYTAAYDVMYADLAAKHGALIYPFFLEGVALERDLNQGDGMHPNAKGVAEIVRRITPKVEELIGRAVAVR